ncbi:MAG TPA: hypothetical protein VIL69_19925 [Roseomonas sp.]
MSDVLAELTRAVATLTEAQRMSLQREDRLTMELDVLRIALTTALATLPGAREKVLTRLSLDPNEFFSEDVRPIDPGWAASFTETALELSTAITRRTREEGSVAPPRF